MCVYACVAIAWSSINDATMPQQPVVDILYVHVHTERTEELDLASVANEFVSSSTRRMNYFGKF